MFPIVIKFILCILVSKSMRHHKEPSQNCERVAAYFDGRGSRFLVFYEGGGFRYQTRKSIMMGEIPKLDEQAQKTV